jgi:FkbM family methyltransferase
METKLNVDSTHFKVEYGSRAHMFKDVTFEAVCACYDKGRLVIPAGDDKRAALFGDPVYGVEKTIRIFSMDKDHPVSFGITEEISMMLPWNHPFVLARKTLANVHSVMRLKHGLFSEEFPEQMLETMFIQPDDVVLELGANVGRNTLVIASILQDASKLLAVESCPESFAKLQENIEANKDRLLMLHRGNLKQSIINVENKALSNVPLMQKGWNTFPMPVNDQLPDDTFKKVETITFANLEQKHNLKFNVLVADVEGAMFSILANDAANVLKNMRMVVIENDFKELREKQFVDATFATFGFRRVFVQPGGWGPCSPCFYEVWER